MMCLLTLALTLAALTLPLCLAAAGMQSKLPPLCIFSCDGLFVARGNPI